MSETDFDRFIKFIELDKEIHQLSSEKSNLIREVVLQEQEIETIHHDVEVSHQKLLSLRKKIHLLELELKSLDLNESEKKDRIENVQNTREYYSLERELENIKKEKNNLESSILQLYDDLELEDEKYEKIISESSSRTVDLEKNIQNYQQRISNLDKQLEVFNHQKIVLEKNVTAEFLDQYNSMHESIINPIVPASKDICSACYYLITPQDIGQLKQHKLVSCQGCYRLLYSPTNNKEQEL